MQVSGITHRLGAGGHIYVAVQHAMKLRKLLIEMKAAGVPCISTLDRSMIYFIGRPGLVKIGRSVDPWARLGKLQTGAAEPLRMLLTMPGGAAQENALHRRFAHLRVHGEWFRLTADLADFIEASSRKTSHERKSETKLRQIMERIDAGISAS
jgi:hypothetical protein